MLTFLPSPHLQVFFFAYRTKMEPTTHKNPAKTSNYQTEEHGTKVNKSGEDRVSVDAKAVNCVVSFCSCLGLVLVVTGAVLYSQIDKGDHTCSCPEEGDCCEPHPSLCAECWCPDDEENELVAGGYCASYNRGESGAGPISVAIAGVIVCVVSATMLITMRWCKSWSEKHLHVRYPPVIPVSFQSERV